MIDKYYFMTSQGVLGPLFEPVPEFATTYDIPDMGVIASTFRGHAATFFNGHTYIGAASIEQLTGTPERRSRPFVIKAAKDGTVTYSEPIKDDYSIGDYHITPVFFQLNGELYFGLERDHDSTIILFKEDSVGSGTFSQILTEEIGDNNTTGLGLAYSIFYTYNGNVIHYSRLHTNDSVGFIKASNGHLGYGDFTRMITRVSAQEDRVYPVPIIGNGNKSYENGWYRVNWTSRNDEANNFHTYYTALTQDFDTFHNEQSWRGLPGASSFTLSVDGAQQSTAVDAFIYASLGPRTGTDTSNLRFSRAWCNNKGELFDWLSVNGDPYGLVYFDEAENQWATSPATAFGPAIRALMNDEFSSTVNTNWAFWGDPNSDNKFFVLAPDQSQGASNVRMILVTFNREGGDMEILGIAKSDNEVVNVIGQMPGNINELESGDVFVYAQREFIQVSGNGRERYDAEMSFIRKL